MLDELELVHSWYRDEVKDVREFTVNLSESINASFEKVENGLSRLTEQERELKEPRFKETLSQLGQELDCLVALEDLMGGGRKEAAGLLRLVSDISQKAGMPSKFVDMLREMAKPLAHMHYFAEMVVVYLVTLQEAFVGDYLRAVFHVKPSLLRTKQKLHLTFEEADNLDSYETFRNYLENSATERLMGRGIDDLSEGFKERLNLSLEEFPDWDKLREASYRRNLIVHNKGQVDQKYRKETGYKGPDRHLAISREYLLSTSDAIVKFIDFIHERVSDRVR